VAADGSDTSLLLQVKKQKKHKDGQSQNDSGLTECTIQEPGSGGGCKAGLKWVCEKMKSGNKCCGCVADKNVKQAPAGQGGENHTTFCGGTTSRLSPSKHPLKAVRARTELCCCHTLTVMM